MKFSGKFSVFLKGLCRYYGVISNIISSEEILKNLGETLVLRN